MHWLCHLHEPEIPVLTFLRKFIMEDPLQLVEEHLLWSVEQRDH
jgi:hypothetical protein